MMIGAPREFQHLSQIDQRVHGLARSAHSVATENLISIKEAESKFRY
jgi:hypothetical protein